MREIKFRGMLRNGKWVYGGYVKLKSGAHCILSGECNRLDVNGEPKNILEFNTVKYKTVGEYTGLKDKKGVEIYEGDILEYHTSTVPKGESPIIRNIVKWDDDNGCFEGHHIGSVIGNIWENPELIQGA